MAIQLEDCVDCLKVLYPDYDFLFLFDHSQGHSKKRVGTLQASHVNLKFGGGQPLMRDTEITEGCLGPFNPTLHVSDIQNIAIRSTDDRPFYLSPQQSIQHYHNIDTGQVNNRMQENIPVLIDELKTGHNVELPLGKWLSAIEIRNLAQQHGILLTTNKPVVEEGWVGKPKASSKYYLNVG